jgi:16S rRNA (adenine(1408)-N(1))-methyltransferase
LFIATDANPDALLETAWKAGRKPTRGGLSNLICISEPLDVLAAELGAVADRITVILPWGSLLKTVAAPGIESLRHIASLCLPEADIEVVFSYDRQRDAREKAPLGGAVLDVAALPHLYQEAGLQIITAERIPQPDLCAYETTWAKRLAFGRPREVWRIRARS